MTNAEKRDYLTDKFKAENRNIIDALKTTRADNNNCGLLEAIDRLYEQENHEPFDGNLTIYVYDI